MLRPTSAAMILLLSLVTLASAACGDDEPTTPTAPTPTSVTETFSDSINVNGARTHQFPVTQTGSVTATLTALEPDSAAIVGLSLGTWNTQTASCQIIIANDSATQAATVIGSASVGQFCVRVYDVGQLSRSASYTVTVTHF